VRSGCLCERMLYWSQLALLALSDGTPGTTTENIIQEVANGTLNAAAAESSDLRHGWNNTAGEGHHAETPYCAGYKVAPGEDWVNVTDCTTIDDDVTCDGTSGCIYTSHKNDLRDMEAPDAPTEHYDDTDKTHEANYAAIDGDSASVHDSLQEGDHANPTPEEDLENYDHIYENDQNVVVADTAHQHTTATAHNHTTCQPCQGRDVSDTEGCGANTNKDACEAFVSYDGGPSLCFWIGTYTYDEQEYEKPSGFKEPCPLSVDRLQCTTGLDTEVAAPTCWCGFSAEPTTFGVYQLAPNTCTVHANLTSGDYDLYKDDKVANADVWGTCSEDEDIRCKVVLETVQLLDGTSHVEKHLEMHHRTHNSGSASTYNKHRCFATSKPDDRVTHPLSESDGVWHANTNKFESEGGDCKCECKTETEQTEEEHTSPHTQCKTYYGDDDNDCESNDNKVDCETPVVEVDGQNKRACHWSDGRREFLSAAEVKDLGYDHALSTCSGNDQYIDFLSYPIRHLDNLNSDHGKRFQDIKHELSLTHGQWCRAALGVFRTDDSAAVEINTEAATTKWCKASDRHNLEICADITDETECGNDPKCYWGGCASAQQIHLVDFDESDGTFCDEATASFCRFGQKPIVCPAGQSWSAPANQIDYYQDDGDLTWTCVDDGDYNAGKKQRCGCFPGETLTLVDGKGVCSTSYDTGRTTDTMPDGTPNHAGEDKHGYDNPSDGLPN